MASKTQDALGQVLVQVQEDLRQLRRNMHQMTVQGTGEIVDIQALDAVIHRTESGLRKHAEEYLRSVNRQVLTLPSIEGIEKKTDQIAKWKPLVDNTPVKQAEKCFIVNVLPEKKHKMDSTTHRLFIPRHPGNRSLMQKNYGIELPQLCNTTGSSVPIQRVINDPTMKSLACVPTSPKNKMRFPSSPPEVLSDRMCKHQKELFQTEEQSPTHCGGGPKEGSDHFVTSTMRTPPPTAASRCSYGRLTPPGNVNLKTLPPPVLMSSPVRRFSFIITDGYIDKRAPDFLHFRQHYSLCWGMLEDALSCLERLLREYAIPVALLDGDWLVSLAYSGELEWGRPMDQLLSALINWEEVLNLMRQPGQRYKGERGREAAAIRIQACWRRHCVRAAYLLYRRRRRAAGIIAISWLMHVRLSRVKRALRASRQQHLENFRRRSKYLTDNWEQIMSSRRTVIHIPSLGYSETQRFSMTNLTVQQNVQMGRLCDTYDRNVEVIYVSPVRIGDDLSQYYSRLLELQQDVSLGGPETCQGPCAKRFTILTPEALEYFPTHNMCLSTLVKYSPHTLHRIKKLIQGKQAYVVSGVTHIDDLAVADELGVPLLGTEPALAQLYGTKSGGRRIFSSAGLMVSPGHCNIYTAEQLHESLAQLITDNMEVQRWLFKMDNEFGGRGTAYCDVVHLKCYTWAQHEYQQYGPDHWPRAWAQELVLSKVLEEVPELLAHYARPVNTTLYSTWDQFLQVFLRQGGTLEAYPPSDSVACLSADLLVEPGGKVSMLSCGDHLHVPSLLETAGSFVPQTSICPDLLSSICARVGRACQESHIIGHVSLDLVAFMKPNSQEQQVWATDLDLCYSNQLAMTKLLLMMTRGHLDCHTGCLEVSLSFKEDKLSQDHKKAKPAPMTRRYAVMSSQLQHTNLSLVHYGVFFQMCKAQGIGFDIKEKQGTLFVLHDSTDRNSLGMLTVAENLQGALINFARNMSVVHQEISAPNMQGESNFKDFIRRIERVLGNAVKTVKADKVRNKTKA